MKDIQIFINKLSTTVDGGNVWVLFSNKSDFETKNYTANFSYELEESELNLLKNSGIIDIVNLSTSSNMTFLRFTARPFYSREKMMDVLTDLILRKI